MIDKKYINHGEQTISDEKIKYFASTVTSSGIDLVFDVLKIVHKNLKPDYQSYQKLFKFRTRTASEILESGVSYGCTDYALLTLSLLREKGIVSMYVEAFSKGWLKEGGAEINGHIFVEVEINNSEYIIDAERACIMKWYDRHVVYRKGFDSWGIGIKNFEDMKLVANDFRIEYNNLTETNGL